jgi:DNA anti-recombination protein RmuC
MITIELLVYINLSLTCLLIYLALNSRKSQSSDPTPLLMNLAKNINEKLDNANEKQTQNSFQVKEILNNQSTESREKIFSSLREIQGDVSKTINDALFNMQKSNSFELDKIANQSKLSFEQIYEANNKKLSDIQTEIERRLNENLANNLKSFNEVSQKLGEMSKTAQVMIDSTASIDKLNRIFDRTSAKSFGGFSEKYLESLLDTHLKNLWKSQVMIKGSGEAIDFVIELDEVSIGIDSKFPLTAFCDYDEAEEHIKDSKLKEYIAKIKNMATDISSKYGGHFTHLLLYIPSEIMYNEVAKNQQLMDKMHNLKVVPVSPISMMSVIYAIAQLKDKLELNESAQLIQKRLNEVAQALSKFQEEYDKLGKKLNEAQNLHSSSSNRMNRLSTSINSIRQLEPQEEILLLEPVEKELI